MDFQPKLDHAAEVPLYRQLSEQIAQQIRSGLLARGERLPATRELAGLLGLNRTTVSAAYEILESEGLISRAGGPRKLRHRAAPTAAGGVDWNGLLERSDTSAGRAQRRLEQGRHQLRGLAAVARPVSAGRVSRDLRRRCWPAGIWRTFCNWVRPSGYEPLRRYLMEEARRQQVAGPGDDLLITNGCQQALDLIGRVLLRPGDTVAVEDPVYTGLKNLLTGHGRAALRHSGGADGMDAAQLERVLERERPRFLVVTSEFPESDRRDAAAGRAAGAAGRGARRRACR